MSEVGKHLAVVPRKHLDKTCQAFNLRRQAVKIKHEVRAERQCPGVSEHNQNNNV